MSSSLLAASCKVVFNDARIIIRCLYVTSFRFVSTRGGGSPVFRTFVFSFDDTIPVRRALGHCSLTLSCIPQCTPTLKVCTPCNPLWGTHWGTRPGTRRLVHEVTRTLRHHMGNIRRCVFSLDGTIPVRGAIA